MKSVCVIGGGPAGMMAAYAAAAAGHRARLFEKNEKLGKKLYITGKGRCNITNAAPIADFFEHIVSNRNFMYSAFYTFDNTRLLEWLKRRGLPTKTERGGRVFPVSDKSSDVIRTLQKALEDAGAEVSLNTEVQSIRIQDGRCIGVIADGRPVDFDHVIVATGGVSYASTGSTGDGYAFAQAAGHKVVTPRASLVGVNTADDLGGMAGLTLKNVGLTLMCGGKAAYNDMGEMLITHTGVSGPLVLSASAYIRDDAACRLIIDLKPALDEKTLDKRLVREFADKSNADLANVLRGLLPAKMIPFILQRVRMDGGKKAHSVTKEERAALLKTLKALTLDVKAKRPLSEAVITQGGVSVHDIDPSTMRSRLCDGLSFAGEVVDVDGLTGGYNLQIAFSTGYLAGQGVE